MSSCTDLNHPNPEHAEMARTLVEETHRNDGLASVDLDRFWADQYVSNKDPCGEDIPQVPLGIGMMGECVFDELDVPMDLWRYESDEGFRLGLNRVYNDRAERIVGKRLLPETPEDAGRRYPPVRGLHDIFEARQEWHNHSWWLRPAAHDEESLASLLDRVEARVNGDLRAFLLPPGWDAERECLSALGVAPPLYRSQRGPVTFATSVFGVENLLFLLLDNPCLAARFRDAILAAMLGIARVLDTEAGYTPQTSLRGFYFLDDNCCLLNPELYAFFGYPILKGVFEVYAPEPGQPRGQHSDSAMGHLLPVLGSLDLTSVNFGPTLTVRDIREHCPQTIIEGQLAPFTFCRNEEERIVLEFLRDFEQARERRGLRFATAGSVNNGSRLTSLRLIMAAIQRYGRYDQ